MSHGRWCRIFSDVRWAVGCLFILPSLFQTNRSQLYIDTSGISCQCRKRNVRKFLRSAWLIFFQRLMKHVFEQTAEWPAAASESNLPICCRTRCRLSMNFLGQLSDYGKFISHLCTNSLDLSRFKKRKKIQQYNLIGGSLFQSVLLLKSSVWEIMNYGWNLSDGCRSDARSEL